MKDLWSSEIGGEWQVSAVRGYGRKVRNWAGDVRRIATMLLCAAVVSGCTTHKASDRGMTPLPFSPWGVRYSVVVEGAQQHGTQAEVWAVCSFQLKSESGRVFSGCKTTFAVPRREPTPWRLFGPGLMGGGRPYWGRHRICPTQTTNAPPVFLELDLFDSEPNVVWSRAFTKTCEGVIQRTQDSGLGE